MLETAPSGIDLMEGFSKRDEKESVFEKAKLYEGEKAVIDFFNIESVETSDDNQTRITLSPAAGRRLFGVKERGGKTEIGFNSGSIGNERIKYTIDVADADGVKQEQPFSATALESHLSLGRVYKTTGTVKVRREMDGDVYTLPFKIENPRMPEYPAVITFDASLDDVILALDVAKKGTEIADGVQEGKDIDAARKEEVERNHDAALMNEKVDRIF
jgi:hypothetical protein